MTYTVFVLDNNEKESEIWYKNGSLSLMYFIYLIAEFKNDEITYNAVIEFLKDYEFTKTEQIDNAYLLTAYEHIHVLSFNNNILRSIKNVVTSEIYDD